jgi:hypothetical protein
MFLEGRAGALGSRFNTLKLFSQDEILGSIGYVTYLQQFTFGFEWLNHVVG